MQLSLKKQASDDVKNDIINGNYNNIEYDAKNDIDAYKVKWQTEINGLLSNPAYCGVDLELIKRLINTSHKNKLIETIIGDIKLIIRYLSMPDNEFQNSVEKVQYYFSKLSSDIDRKILATNIKKATQIRDKWKDKIKVNEAEINLSEIILDIIADEEERMNNTKDKQIDGGKKGKQCVITDKIKSSLLSKYKLQIGQKFNTASELANYVNKSNKCITEWRAKGWII